MTKAIDVQCGKVFSELGLDKLDDWTSLNLFINPNRKINIL
jgi:hypothetical protein